MTGFGSVIVPLVMCIIISAGLLKRVNVFEAFMEGAKEGLQTAGRILPALVALVTAVGMLKASGLMQLLTLAVAPAGKLLALPREVIPLALIRPLSGSGALAVFSELLKTHGADSMAGKTASVMMGSTETTFYTIALYYGSLGIKDIRHSVPSALAADITGFVMSAFFVRLLMGQP